MFQAAAWDEIHGAGPMSGGSDEKLVEAGRSTPMHQKAGAEPIVAESEAPARL